MKASGNDLVHQETLSRVAVTRTRRQRMVMPETATRSLMLSLVSERLYSSTRHMPRLTLATSTVRVARSLTSIVTEAESDLQNVILIVYLSLEFGSQVISQRDILHYSMAMRLFLQHTVIPTELGSLVFIIHVELLVMMWLLCDRNGDMGETGVMRDIQLCSMANWSLCSGVDEDEGGE